MQYSRLGTVQYIQYCTVQYIPEVIHQSHIFLCFKMLITSTVYTVLKSRTFFAFDTKFKSSFPFLNLFFSRSVLTLSQKESESSHKKGTCHSKSGCTGTRSCLFYMPDICTCAQKPDIFCCIGFFHDRARF